MATLILTQCHLESIAAAALDALPAEACGLLIGRAERAAIRVSSVSPMTNIRAEARTDRFEIEPEALLKAHRAAREADLAVLGHFHSHPDGSATPSRTDAEWAHEEGAIWLIQPVPGTTAGVPRAFLARPGGAIHGRFDPLAIEIADR